MTFRCVMDKDRTCNATCPALSVELQIRIHPQGARLISKCNLHGFIIGEMPSEETLIKFGWSLDDAHRLRQTPGVILFAGPDGA